MMFTKRAGTGACPYGIVNSLPPYMKNLAEFAFERMDAIWDKMVL